MTAQAREVLADCELVLTMLEDETDLHRWRINWVAGLALIRAVGNVMESSPDALTAKASDEAHARWKSEAPEHEIFREFIRKERNNVLKQYSFSLDPREQIAVAVVQGKTQARHGRKENYTVYELDENLFRPTYGYREGEDARDVFADAILWWKREIHGIEMRAMQLRGQ